MKKEIDLKTVVKNLSYIGVNASVTKSRLDILKVLTPPQKKPSLTN